MSRCSSALDAARADAFDGYERALAEYHTELLERVVRMCARYEGRPRIHVNPAVRRHGSPRTPQVWATVAYEIALRCGVEDTHSYRPGWGQSTLRANLGYNEISLVLHFPFDGMSPELERIVTGIETALGHSLSRKRMRVHAR